MTVRKGQFKIYDGSTPSMMCFLTRLAPRGFTRSFIDATFYHDLPAWLAVKGRGLGAVASSSSISDLAGETLRLFLLA